MLCNFYAMGCSVVTAQGSGAQSLSDLPGKTVAFAQGSMEYALVRANFYNLGIDESTVTWVEMDPSQFNSALQSGEIDAYCGDVSLAGQAVVEGFGKVLSYPYLSDVGYDNLVIVTTGDKIEEKRDWLQQLIFAHYEVAEMVASVNGFFGPAEAEALGLSEEGILEEQGQYQWIWDLEEEDLMFIRNLSNYFVQMGVLEELPDMEALFDFTFLEKLSQEVLS